MAVINPWSITYGTRTVGGADAVLLHGPYALEKNFNTLSLSFDIVVVATTYDDLQGQSDAVETDFRKRDQTLIINLDGSVWTYTFGQNLLNSQASISKSGDAETDKGLSRSYTVTIEAELPADDGSPVSGLRDIDYAVSILPSRQRMVSMQGAYTATEAPARLASANYLHANGADAEASTFLTALDAAATFELVQEDFQPDRNDHICNFSRAYVELLVEQSPALLDDPQIRDHSVTFTDVTQHPGDSGEAVYRLRRVLATYECAIDIEQTTDLKTVFDGKVKPHLKAIFEKDFQPQTFCVDNQTVNYNQSSKRLSASVQLLYQPGAGQVVVEVNEAATIRELRHVDYTPVHEDNELAMHADVGWLTMEASVSRTVTVLGAATPITRIGSTSQSRGIAIPGQFLRFIVGGGNSFSDGWNLIANESEVTPLWIGHPDDGQIQATQLRERVVARFNARPGKRKTGIGGIFGAPIIRKGRDRTGIG